MSSELTSHTLIEEEFYKDILKVLPVLTVDLIVRTAQEEFVLVKRKSHPLKDRFWTPGGRIYKGETAQQAAKRKCLEELGLETELKNWSFIGFFEINARKSHFNLDCSTHTLSLVFAYSASIDHNLINIDDTSSEFDLSKSLPELFIHLFQNSLMVYNA